MDIKILKEIDVGKRSFGPETEDMSLQDFQAIARLLQDMESMGLFDIRTVHTSKRQAGNLIDLVVIQDSLSEYGRSYLKDHLEGGS